MFGVIIMKIIIILERLSFGSFGIGGDSSLIDCGRSRGVFVKVKQ